MATFSFAKMGPLVTWRLPAAKENHGSPLPSALLNQHVVAVES